MLPLIRRIGWSLGAVHGTVVPSGLENAAALGAFWRGAGLDGGHLPFAMRAREGRPRFG